MMSSSRDRSPAAFVVEWIAARAKSGSSFLCLYMARYKKSSGFVLVGQPSCAWTLCVAFGCTHGHIIVPMRVGYPYPYPCVWEPSRRVLNRLLLGFPFFFPFCFFSFLLFLFLLCSFYIYSFLLFFVFHKIHKFQIVFKNFKKCLPFKKTIYKFVNFFNNDWN